MALYVNTNVSSINDGAAPYGTINRPGASAA